MSGILKRTPLIYAAFHYFMPCLSCILEYNIQYRLQGLRFLKMTSKIDLDRLPQTQVLNEVSGSCFFTIYLRSLLRETAYTYGSA